VSSLTLDIQNAFPMEWKLNLTTLGGVVVAEDLNVSSGNSIDALALSTSSKLVIPISQSQWNIIKSEGKLILQVVSNTPSFPQLVNLYNSYFIDVRVKAGVVLNAEVE
jgi:cell division septal protein FtsQ